MCSRLNCFVWRRGIARGVVFQGAFQGFRGFGGWCVGMVHFCFGIEVPRCGAVWCGFRLVVSSCGPCGAIFTFLPILCHLSVLVNEKL